MAAAETTTPGQLSFAIETFERIHPTEFQRRFLSQGTRHDGRGFAQFRPTHIVRSTISTAQGSATVRIGNTTVVCGIKAEVSEPDVSTPKAGYLVTNVELSPMCSARFRPGAPSEQAQVASEHISRLFQSAIDVESLGIEEGRACWVLYADIVCIKHDGNVLDAAIVALQAALRDLQLPKVEFDAVSGVVSADKSKMQPLEVEALYPTTLSVLDGNYLVADADDAEEQMAASSVLVVLTDSAVANIWKRGALVERKLVEKCVAMAEARKQELATLLN
ncbi:exosome component 8 [Linderina pennispora]|uniref:Ribosomal RNA-processing protein 43 n=1 Tax=Linderina pennispora TaxID=61395 RepID=A0A1Y1WBH3_9FUNG|nr:exosome component 8 [Linderina pennispora]ORX70887.1 exosome component 8 [Linderina pennispora]